MLMQGYSLFQERLNFLLIGILIEWLETGYRIQKFQITYMAKFISDPSDDSRVRLIIKR